MLFVHSTAGRYGADRSLLLLTTSLRARGWQVRVALGSDGPLHADLVASGVDVVRTEVGMLRGVYTKREWATFFMVGLPRAVRGLARLGRAADVVHINTSAMIGAQIGAFLSRRPVVLHQRETWSHKPRMWAVYGRFSGRTSTAVVANSRAVGAEMAALGFGDKVRVVHNGLVFRPRRPPAADADGVVTVGRINEGKGHKVLVDAVHELRAAGVPARATIAGDVFPGGEAHERDLVDHIAARRMGDAIALPGFVEDVDELLSRHLVFALPSVRPEGFGLSLIEAMAQGLPSVATNVGGPAEIIEHGRTGLLVPPGDANALARALRSLLEDPELRRTLGEAGAADVRERFSLGHTVDGVERVYEEVLSRG